MLFSARRITVNYGPIKALEDISFNISEGEIVSMIGPNGAGKSTALKAVFGLVKKRKGTVTFEGEDISNKKTSSLIKKGMSYISQGGGLFPSLSVGENLKLGAYVYNDKRILDEGLEKAYQLFPELKVRKAQLVGTLSGGEQQMVAIARALIHTPKLLLADEPSIGLSSYYIDLIFNKIEEINWKGTAVLLVEQNARMALEIAHRAYVFKIGRIFLEGKGEDLLENSQVKKAFLGE